MTYDPRRRSYDVDEVAEIVSHALRANRLRGWEALLPSRRRRRDREVVRTVRAFVALEVIGVDRIKSDAIQANKLFIGEGIGR